MAIKNIFRSACDGTGANTIYEAHPLNVSDSTNIRLLSIAPQEPQDDSKMIRLNIGVFPFDNSPEYTALSYVWGQEPPSKEIILDNHPVVVRSNLWDFLDRARRHDPLRLRDRIQHLWIDALCIDQSSVAERNHQVAIMGPIYTRAHSVVIWLGTNPPTLVESVGRLTRNRWTQNIDQHLSDVKTLCHAEYWRRMWTIQEFVLPKELHIWCGLDEEIPMDDLFEWGFTTNLDKGPTADLGNAKIHKFSTMRINHHHDSGREKSDLYNVLYHCYDSPGQCSDLKDRIYSVLSLATEEDFTKFPIHIDYDQTASNLFFSLVDRRFRQLDIESPISSRPHSLACYTSPLAKYMEIESDQSICQFVSEMSKLGIQSADLPANSGEHSTTWRQMKRIISRGRRHKIESHCMVS